MAQAGSIGRDSGALREALRQARLAEAAHFDASMAQLDSKSIRLALLKDDLAPEVAASEAAADLFDLALVPGDPPKLWIDLITYVIMEPDHRTYRLIQDRQNAREILFESDDMSQMGATVRQHMAHRLISRERQAASNLPTAPVSGYSTGSLVLAWLSGFVLGTMVLLSAAIYLEWFDI